MPYDVSPVTRPAAHTARLRATQCEWDLGWQPRPDPKCVVAGESTRGSMSSPFVFLFTPKRLVGCLQKSCFAVYPEEAPKDFHGTTAPMVTTAGFRVVPLYFTVFS